MEQVHKKGFNADLVWEDLKHCCRSEDLCSECQHENCTIGYAKQCIKNYWKEPKKEVPDGAEHVPTTDFKVFDETELETAIANILKECKDCKGEHTENCIINVIRNCYEVGLFGDVQAFEGSVLQYLMFVKNNFPEKSLKIASIYNS